MNKIGMIGLIGAASLAAAANAGFTGWQAIARSSGSNTIVDVFAGFNTAGDKLLNVFNMNIAVTGGAAFVQQAGVAPSKWKPIDDTSSTSSVDSFVTLGGFSYGGEFFTSYSSAGDPNFTNYTTNNATTIPALAGWYNGSPTSPDILAINLATASSNWTGAKDSASAAGNLGVWVGHFLVNRSITDASWTLTFSGSAAFNTGTNQADSRVFHNIPAPGALALLGLAGFASRRRRA